MTKQYAVRVTYRDGSSAVFGPVRSRQEARRLAAQVSGPLATARIMKWASDVPSVGGVLSRRPAPVEPTPAGPPAEPAPVIAFAGGSNVEHMIAGGSYLDQVKHVRLLGSFGQFDYYVDGQSGVNSETTYGVSIGSTNISIYDTALGGKTVTGLQLFTDEDAQDFGVLDVDDFALYAEPSFSSPEEDSFRIDCGLLDLTTVQRVRLFWDNDTNSSFIDPTYTEQTSDHILIGTGYGMGLAGETVSKVELYDEFPGTVPLRVYADLALLIQLAAADIELVYDDGLDELYVTSNGPDISACQYINYQGNGSGQLTVGSHFIVNSGTSITIVQASFYLNGGTLTELLFLGGGPGFTQLAAWNGSLPLS